MFVKNDAHKIKNMHKHLTLNNCVYHLVLRKMAERQSQFIYLSLDTPTDFVKRVYCKQCNSHHYITYSTLSTLSFLLQKET